MESFIVMVSVKGLSSIDFFENVVFRSVLKKNTHDSQAKTRLPEGGFLFIDDQLPQIDYIVKDFQIPKLLGLPLLCYHYTPDALSDVCMAMDEKIRTQVLLKQIETFIRNKIVLTNQEALNALKSCTGLSHPVTQKDVSVVVGDLHATKSERKGDGVMAQSP